MRPGTPGFYGERLREAREARGITATSLASLIGVTRAAVSQYECGSQSPSPQVMQCVARTLNLPTEFFLRPPSASSNGIVFYRSMSSATKRARVSAERRYGWLRTVVAFLREYIQFPASDFPRFDVPLDARMIDARMIERLATETRRYFGLKDGPVGNMTWLLENHGGIVASYDLDAEPLDAFSEWRDDENSLYVVLNSMRTSAARLRFNVAHELGHRVLHWRIPRLPNREDQSFKAIEKQSHHFACAFLLPADAYRKDLGAVVTLDRCLAIKCKWGASVQAMVMRARQVDSISEEEKKRLWVNLGQRKWRTNEPLDDSLPLEPPSFLAKSIHLLVENNIASPFEIPQRLALSPRDVEELAGLPPGYLAVPSPRVSLVGGDDSSRSISFLRRGREMDE